MEFHHQTITNLLVIPEDLILHGLTTLTDEHTDAPTAHLDDQQQAIESLRDVSNSWSTPNERPEPATSILIPTPAQTRRAMKILERKLKQTTITHQPNPRVPNESEKC